MSSFRGQFAYTIDHKGRVNIPAKFRKSLNPDSNETFVITIGYDGCLAIYPLDEWQKFEEKLKKLNDLVDENRRYVRAVSSNASESQLDKQGRVTIPPHLAKYGNLEKDVLIIGNMEKIELWNPEKYTEYMGPITIENFAQLTQKVKKGPEERVFKLVEGSDGN
jgi:MraZ protein